MGTSWRVLRAFEWTVKKGGYSCVMAGAWSKVAVEGHMVEA